MSYQSVSELSNVENSKRAFSVHGTLEKCNLFNTTKKVLDSKKYVAHVARQAGTATLLLLGSQRPIECSNIPALGNM